jgi:hypothetical protein
MLYQLYHCLLTITLSLVLSVLSLDDPSNHTPVLPSMTPSTYLNIYTSWCWFMFGAVVICWCGSFNAKLQSITVFWISLFRLYWVGWFIKLHLLWCLQWLQVLEHLHVVMLVLIIAPNLYQWASCHRIFIFLTTIITMGFRDLLVIPLLEMCFRINSRSTSWECGLWVDHGQRISYHSLSARWNTPRNVCSKHFGQRICK